MAKRVALVVRGHIRDAFANDRLARFLTRIASDHRMCVHLYVQTWDHWDASAHCSWRPLDDAYLDRRVTPDVLRAYLPIPTYGMRILRDDDAHLVGNVDGTIGGTPKLGWKRMWYGLFTIMNDIRNGGFQYDTAVSMRFDFFGAYVSGRSLYDYGRPFSTDDIVDWIIHGASSDTQAVSFLSDHACTGVDNCYMGPTRSLFTLCARFHFNLDSTCMEVGHEYNQEKMVFKACMRM